MNDEQYTELNESIDRLSNNTQDTNNAVNDLREYLEEKDQKQEEKEQEQKEQEEVQAEETETKEAENNVKSEQDTRTYTELLQSIDEGITVQNGLIAGQFVTDGILCGVLLLTVLWNKLN